MNTPTVRSAPLVIGSILFCTLLTGAAPSRSQIENRRDGRAEGLFSEIAGAGEPLVLLHGGQMDRRMWDAQFTAFAKSYRVIRYDIRGFGKSDVPARPYSNAGDLYSLLRHLNVKRTKLIGLSLGAAVAIDFALTHPEMVDSLILVCPGLGGFHFQDKANDLRAVVEAARDGNYDKAAELWLQNPYMSVAMENPALRSKLRQLARDNGPLLVEQSVARATHKSSRGGAPARHHRSDSGNRWRARCLRYSRDREKDRRRNSWGREKDAAGRRPSRSDGEAR